MRRAAVAVMVTVALGIAGAAEPRAADAQTPTVRATLESGGSVLVEPPTYDRPPLGRRLTARTVLAAAEAAPKLRAVRAAHPRAYARVYVRQGGNWQVSLYDPPPPGGLERKEVAQAYVSDRTGRVTEAWTGVQVAWPMARGYPGQFGRAVNAPWLWIALCVLFVLPFARPPLRMLHLDLAVMLAFSISYAFFGAADLGVSVPSAYPLLAYLLVRMLAVAARRSRALGAAGGASRAGGEGGACRGGSGGGGPGGGGRRVITAAVPRLLLGPDGLLVGCVFLVGFRIALNVTNGNVIDVGYAGVIGAERITGPGQLYGTFPADNEHGDTYGPVAYAAYVPFVRLLGWSGRWDGLPAAHAAALAFDLGTAVLLWLLGRRLRSDGLGRLLAYLWLAFPFTLLVTNSGSNDALVSLLVVAALLAAARPAGRGALTALAGLTKFAPLALAPVFVTYGARRGRPRAAILTGAAFALTIVVVLAPLAGELGVAWRQTLGFQADRSSPFSIWGWYGLPGWTQSAAQVLAALLAVALAFVPRRRDPAVLAALAAATLIALQLTVEHWFYLYLVWFAPLVWVALLTPPVAPGEAPARSRPLPAAGPARPSRARR